MRLQFTAPLQAPVLIYDAQGAEQITGLIPEAKFEILHTRFEKINVQVLLAMLYKHGFKVFGSLVRHKYYVDAYIEFVQPKVVATFIDNAEPFYQISSRWQGQLRTVFFQNGRRTVSMDIFGSLTRGRDYRVDHMFVFSDAVGELYKEFIDGEVHVVGSLKNNQMDKVEVRKSKDIVWVSNWEPEAEALAESADVESGCRSLEMFLEQDIDVLINVQRWCLSNGYQLVVAGRSLVESARELTWYRDRLKGVFVFKAKRNVLSTYQTSDQSALTVVMDSTIGYEVFARGGKVAMFPTRSEVNRDSSYRLGWPEILPDDGPFWSHSSATKDVERTIANVLGLSKKDWSEIVLKFSGSVMAFDPGNRIAKKVLRSILE